MEDNRKELRHYCRKRLQNNFLHTSEYSVMYSMVFCNYKLVLGGDIT